MGASALLPIAEMVSYPVAFRPMQRRAKRSQLLGRRAL